jgi:hypothetical protein
MQRRTQPGKPDHRRAIDESDAGQDHSQRLLGDDSCRQHHRTAREHCRSQYPEVHAAKALDVALPRDGGPAHRADREETQQEIDELHHPRRIERVRAQEQDRADRNADRDQGQKEQAAA